MPQIDFKLKKIESEFKEAKIIEMSNHQKSITSEFPGVMFDVQTKEDLDAVKRYYFQRLPDNHIIGFTVPFSKLPANIPVLIDNVPHDVTYMCDLETEIFWYGNLKSSIQQAFYDNPIIHSSVKNGIRKIAHQTNLQKKIEAHKKLWNDILQNRKVLTSLLTNYIIRQNAYQIDFLSSFGPLLLDKDHLDYLEECFTLTRRLYRNSTDDIEERGKIIALYANFHSDFLVKRSNINEFLKMIERTNPKALIFKIFTRNEFRGSRYQDNYEFLIKGISDLSGALQIPTIYFSTHTGGLKANTRGIDIFCEPYNHEDNVRKERGMNQDFLEKYKKSNPQFMSGKIYDIKTGEFISRKEFQATRLTKVGIDSPITNLSSTKPETIVNMTDKSFREFSKMILMESRNFEEDELYDGIMKNNIHKTKIKLSNWEGIGLLK